MSQLIKKCLNTAIGVAQGAADYLNDRIKKPYKEGEKESSSQGPDAAGPSPQADQPEASSSKPRTEPSGDKAESQTLEDEIARLKDRIVELERERSVLMGECSCLQGEIRERERLEVAFPKLVKRLHRLSDMPEIQKILAENGLTLDSDFASFSDGFMRVRNEGVTQATLERPALVRADDLVEPGIVLVPLGEPGAEPPKSEDKSKSEDN